MRRWGRCEDAHAYLDIAHAATPTAKFTESWRPLPCFDNKTAALTSQNWSVNLQIAPDLFAIDFVGTVPNHFHEALNCHPRV